MLDFTFDHSEDGEFSTLGCDSQEAKTVRYRNGGVTVARGVGRVANFEPDSIVLSEVGAR